MVARAAAVTLGLAVAFGACADEGRNTQGGPGFGPAGGVGGFINPGECAEGATRECRLDLGQQGQVQHCFYGVETCEGGAWGPCTDGEVVSKDTKSGSTPYALGPPAACTHDPCDPNCQIYDEVPTATLVAQEVASTQWSSGPPYDPPAEAIDEPCQEGTDCQANHYCDQPITSNCAHSKCEAGDGLSATCDPCVSRVCAADPDCCQVPSTCTDLFGSAAGYVDCGDNGSSGTQCLMAFASSGQSCDQVCALGGATCVDAYDNSGTCGVDPDPGITCSTVGFETTALCLCDNPTAGLGWDQACVDAVATECGARCDTANSPPEELGECQHYDPGATDPSCVGVDLTIDTTCNGFIPVCNVGDTAAPAGTVLTWWAAGAGEFGSESPNLGTAGGTCTITDPIDPGACADLTGCGATAGAEIMINAPGSTGAIAECHGGAGLNNWSIYEPGKACVDPICTDESADGDFTQVNLLIMVDKSGSMGSSGLWTPAMDAIKAFVSDPGVAGAKIALRFYPDDAPTTGCSSSTCSEAACADPLVPLAAVTADPAPADAQEQLLIDAIDSKWPGGGTPTRVALGGAVAWGQAGAIASPREEWVVVFITDGDPTECNTNSAGIIAEAQVGYDFYDVRTYAIGLQGANQTQMDGIAAAGGTGSAIYVSNGANVEADLLAALQSIQGTPSTCSLTLPITAFDDTGTVVTNEPGDGTVDVLAQVTDATGCTAGGQEWYYDDNANPSEIILCPNACAVAAADPAFCQGVGEVQSPLDGSCYLFDATQTDQPDAQAACAAWGGELASITSAREQGFINLELGLTGVTWLGGRDNASLSGGTDVPWFWESGDPWTYENWDGAQPNGGTAQNCLMIQNGTWQDRDCLGANGNYGRLCERSAPRKGVRAHTSCAFEFTSTVLTEEYEGVCPDGSGPQWSFFTYDSVTPSDSSIAFEARSADTQAELATATWVPLATSQASPDTQVCSLFGPAPDCPVDVYTTLGGPPQAWRSWLELRATLQPGAPANQFTPELNSWQVTYSCVANQ